MNHYYLLSEIVSANSVFSVFVTHAHITTVISSAAQRKMLTSAYDRLSVRACDQLSSRRAKLFLALHPGKYGST